MGWIRMITDWLYLTPTPLDNQQRRWNTQADRDLNAQIKAIIEQKCNRPAEWAAEVLRRCDEQDRAGDAPLITKDDRRETIQMGFDNLAAMNAYAPGFDSRAWREQHDKLTEMMRALDKEQV